MKAMRWIACLLAAMLLIGMVPAFAAQAKSVPNKSVPYWIGIDVKNNRFTVYRTADNSVVHRWLCSTGTSKTPTPLGTFKLPNDHRNKNRHEWYKFGHYVRFAVRVKGGYHIHSVLYNSKNEKSVVQSSVKKLGSPASHGCIRLTVAHAKWVSENVANGTTVIIHKGVDDPRITSVLGRKAGLSTTPSLSMPPSVKALVLDQTGTVQLTKGEQLQLNCTIQPAAATTTLTWKSSKSKIASVSKNGLVTAKGDGTATITVKATNGVKATVKVRSIDPAAPRSVQLDKTGIVNINVGETLQLSTTVSPDTAVTTVTWTSSKDAYATVDETGLVTGVADGTATITAKTTNNKKASLQVKVIDPNAPKSVKLQQTGLITLKAGNDLQLTPVPFPDNSITTYTWRSSNKKVAVVDKNGVVTAKRKGTAKITVTTANEKKATVKIKVVK